MQDMLKKIILMDKEARKLEDEANQHKIDSELEIEQLRQTIYEDYITRAKDRIERNIEVDRQLAEKQLSAYSKQTNDIKAELKRLYDEKKEEWIDTIVEHVLA